MKKAANIVVLCAMLTLCLCPVNTQADTLSDKIKTFTTNIESKLNQVVSYINAYYHSEKVQAAITEIKAEEKVVAKCVLTAIYNFWLTYQGSVVAFLEAKVQVAILKVTAKIVDNLPFLKAQAVSLLNSALTQAVALLPVTAQGAALAIIALTATARTVIVQKLIDYMATKLQAAAVEFNKQVDQFIETELVKLDAKVAAKIAAL